MANKNKVQKAFDTLDKWIDDYCDYLKNDKKLQKVLKTK